MRPILKVLFVALCVALMPGRAAAQVWTSWTGPTPCAPTPGAATLTGFLSTTTVSLSGPYQAYQLSNGTNCGAWSVNAGQGTSYFYANNNTATPYAAYTQGGLNAPPEFGLVQYYNTVSLVGITFGAPVVNPFLAFVSVGQPGVPVTYSFSSPFSVVSSNTGNAAHWGMGSYSVSGNQLTGNEFSGVIQFTGTFTSLTLSTSDPEYWHGITVGAQGVGPDPTTIPEPSTYILMGTGLLALGLIGRRIA